MNLLKKIFIKKDYVAIIGSSEGDDEKDLNDFLELIRAEKGKVRSIGGFSGTYSELEINRGGGPMRGETIVSSYHQYMIHYKCHREISLLERLSFLIQKP